MQMPCKCVNRSSYRPKHLLELPCDSDRQSGLIEAQGRREGWSTDALNPVVVFRQLCGGRLLTWRLSRLAVRKTASPMGVPCLELQAH